jgi:Fe-S cluster biogenesis protein NfuA
LFPLALAPPKRNIRAMFIQTETTPNPATLKFLPGREVMADGTVDFPNAEAGQRSPLAARLFAIPEVERVFFGSDFITVTKREGDWRHLKPAILGAIMEHFTRGIPLFESEAAAEAEPTYEGEEADIVAQIKELLETRVRPAVASDGGDIIFKGFDGGSGTVFLHLQGSCSGCPSSTITLKNGIENMLRHYVPEVSAVEAV